MRVFVCFVCTFFAQQGINVDSRLHRRSRRSRVVVVGIACMDKEQGMMCERKWTTATNAKELTSVDFLRRTKHQSFVVAARDER